jgi:hypothetical protein
MSSYGDRFQALLAELLGLHQELRGRIYDLNPPGADGRGQRSFASPALEAADLHIRMSSDAMVEMGARFGKAKALLDEFQTNLKATEANEANGSKS